MRRPFAVFACALAIGCDSVWGLEPASQNHPDAGAAGATSSSSASSSTGGPSTGGASSSSSTGASGTGGMGGAGTKADGQSCSADHDCQSGACVMGICCHTSCADFGADHCVQNGQCEPDGSGCAYYAAGTTCMGPTCASGMLNTSTCDGAGLCKPGTSNACAGNYGCADQSTCRTTCTVNTDCASAAYACSTIVPGKCLLAKGEACTVGDQCASDGCVNGFCQ